VGERWHLLSCFAERRTDTRFDLPPTRNRALQWLAVEPSPRIDGATDHYDGIERAALAEGQKSEGASSKA
jgi:hypothetical protein